jgi:predicted DNA-binding transcriptional regulator AlpA
VSDNKQTEPDNEQTEPRYAPEYLDQLLREPEAADMLGISFRTLQNWRVRGGGPQYVKVSGKSVRYRRRDLIDHIDANTRANTSEGAAV